MEQSGEPRETSVTYQRRKYIMEHNTATSSNSKELIAYFILAYAISWAIGIPLALAKQGISQPNFPFWFH